MDAFTVEESFNRMLRYPRFASELPRWKSLRSKYERGISGMGFGCSPRLILDRTDGFENTDVFPLLCFALYFFSKKMEGQHCLDGPSLQQTTGIVTAFFSVWS